MNVLENTDLNFLSRYKDAIYQLLIKPHQFYNKHTEKPYKTSIVFFLLAHYTFFLLSLPFLTSFLLRMRFFLRIHGYLETANIILLNAKSFIFLNIAVFPYLVIIFWFLLGLYFRILLKGYNPKVSELFFLLMTAQTAALFPTMLFMGVFFIFDALMPQNVLWISIVFFGAPIIFMIVSYYLSRRALRIYYQINRGTVHLYLLSPLGILIVVLAFIYIYGVFIA